MFRRLVSGLGNAAGGADQVVHSHQFTFQDLQIFTLRDTEGGLKTLHKVEVKVAGTHDACVFLV